jgi:hypothetical protein
MFACNMTLACPGCGFRTIVEDFYGSYRICGVCGWEDDAVQLANPCSGGGANKESLAECQRRSSSWSKPEMDKHERDPHWRPLTDAEIAHFALIAKTKLWTFKGETAPESAYWRKPPQMANQ